MDDAQMLLVDLLNSADERGSSFSLNAEAITAMGAVRDVHIAEIKPGLVRGNHYHLKRSEVIAVVFSDKWSLHWDTGHGSPVQTQRFVGNGAVNVIPPSGWAHAIRNDGDLSLWIFVTSDLAFERSVVDDLGRDAFPRVITGSTREPG